MSGGVSELVFFVFAVVERNEDAEIVLAGSDADACAGEFGAQLVEPPGSDALFGTCDDECGYRRVMGGLLSDIGNSVRLGASVLGLASVIGRAQDWRNVFRDFPIAL